jgi:uncharacterized membrane protein
MSEDRIAREVSKTLSGGTIAGLLAGEINFQVSEGELLVSIIGIFVVTFFLFALIEGYFGSPTEEDEVDEGSTDEDPDLYYENIRYAS